DGIRDRNVTGVQTCALPIFCPTTGHLFSTGIDGKTIFDDGAITDAAVGGTREAKLGSLKTQLQTLRAQLEFYKLQHVDLPPDFRSEERRVGKGYGSRRWREE